MISDVLTNVSVKEFQCKTQAWWAGHKFAQNSRFPRFCVNLNLLDWAFWPNRLKEKRGLPR